MYNQAYAKVTIPTYYSALLVLMIFSFCGSIRLYSSIPLHVYLTLPGVLTFVSIFCVLLHRSSGNISRASEQFLDCQRRLLKPSKERRKCAMALCPLRVKVGGTYAISRQTLLTFLHVFATNALSLLIALQTKQPPRQ